MIIAGNKIYDYCRDCGKLVRLNKPFFGDLHICLTEAELRAKRQQKNVEAIMERAK